LLAPALQGGLDYDLNALASLIRDWANDSLLCDHALATILISENVHDLHPLIANNPRVAKIKIDLPDAEEILESFQALASCYPTALGGYSGNMSSAAEQLAGATLGALEGVLKTKEFRKEKLAVEDLAKLKKQLVEEDCNGLIEFVESKRTLEDLY